MTKRGRFEKSTLPILNIEMANLVTPQGYAVEVFRVLSLMLHPNDRIARSSFVMSASYDFLESAAARMSPPGVVIISGKPREIEIRPADKFIKVAMAPRFNKKGAKGKADPEDFHSGPNIAATILKRAFQVADEWNEEIGIEKVLAEQSEVFRSEGFVGVGRDKLIEIWYEYRPIAHIAAAFAAMKGRSLQDRRVFFDWIGLSQDILNAGSLIGNRFAEPLLPPDKCWRITLSPSAIGTSRPENFRASVLSTPRPPWSQ